MSRQAIAPELRAQRPSPPACLLAAALALWLLANAAAAPAEEVAAPAKQVVAAEATAAAKPTVRPNAAAAIQPPAKPQGPGAIAAPAPAGATAPIKPAAPPSAFVIELGDAAEAAWQAAAARPSSVDLDASGRRLVADRDANRVLLYGADGALTDTFTAGAPLDADFVAGGNVLITSAQKKAVTELDARHQVVWEYANLTGPREAHRLDNGHTLIADTQPARVIEVDRAGGLVWSYSGDLLLPSAVRPYGDDQVLIADYNRHRVDCIRRDGSVCWRFNHIGHPSQLVVLPDGGFLVAAHKAGGIVHVASDRGVRGYWPLARDLEDFARVDGKLLVAVRPRGPQAPLPALQAKAGGLLASVRSGSRRVRPSPALLPLPDVDTRRRNLIVILFDSLRRDHVAWEGYWRQTMPAVAELVRRATVFGQYIAQAPWTKPSVASLLTSTYPTTHGANSQKPYSQLPTSLVTMAEVLQDAGYFTAAVMENPHMGDRKTAKGFDQGYERYVFLGDTKLADQMPALMADRAIEVLRERPTDRPFFLTMFFMNPHYPYKPHRTLFGDEEAGPSNPGSQNSYDAEIREADTEVGRVLEEVAKQGLADHTIVVFTSDHGEEFQDHGKRFHGDTLFDCVLNPPLVIAGIDRVGRFPGLVREIDLLPTLLDYLGIPVSQELSAQMAGVSVRPFLERGAVPTGLVAYSETRFRNGMRMVSERSETRKVIADVAQGKVQIYDLANDPQEYNDLATPATQRAELRRLVRWQKSLRKAEREPHSREHISEADLERLRQAGYLNDQ